MRPPNFRDLPRSFSQLVDPSRTALVMWDMQQGLAGNAPNLITLRPAARLLLDAAREGGVLVVWSRLVFPPLGQQTGPWLAWMMRRQGVERPEDLQPMFEEGSPGIKFLDGFDPAPGEVVLPKHQPSLFIGTPFEHHLKVGGVRTIVLVGFATDIGIDFTARHAIAEGYFAVVAGDATGAYTAEGHERSLAFLSDWARVEPASRIAAEWANARANAEPLSQPPKEEVI